MYAFQFVDQTGKTMGSETSSKGFFADPAGAIISDLTGSKALTAVLSPSSVFDPVVGKTREYAQAGEKAAAEETKRQDELMKKLALGENPYLTTEDETTETLGV